MTVTGIAQIEELFRDIAAGRKRDVVSVVDRLIMVARDVREIKCTLASSQSLRFEIPGQKASEVHIDRAKGILRAICARLAVLCRDSGQEFSPYGGEGVIKAEVVRSVELSNHGGEGWKVRFKNTTDEQEFTIQAQ